MNVSSQDRLTTANKLIFVKKYDQALAIIEELLAADEHKNNMLVHLRKIELLSGLSRNPSLLERYRTHLKNAAIDSLTRDLCGALIDLWGQLNPVSQSYLTFQKICERKPDCAVAYFGLGLCYEMEEQLEKALHHYQHCLELDPTWYPTLFHISQIYYQLNNQEQGEYYFLLFERSAPYYLHGNFATHKQLCDEFLAEKSFENAETAITTLTDWWLQQKGHCPPEVKIYESLVLAKIAKARGIDDLQRGYLSRAIELTETLLASKNLEHGVLFFVLNIFDDYSNEPEVFNLLRKIVQRAGDNADLLKSIANKLFVQGKISEASILFEEAYQAFPDNEEVRFCRLLAAVKQHGVAVDKYFAAKEQYTDLKNSEVAKSELLVKLHSLNALYGKDPDVHLAIANIYRYLGNQQRAAEHYGLMLKYDHLGRKTRLKYAASLLVERDFAKVADLLKEIHFDGESEQESFLEHSWLLTLCYFEQKLYQEALHQLATMVALEPWNVSYLTYQVMVLTSLNHGSTNKGIDSNLLTLAGLGESELNWEAYGKLTEYFATNNQSELAYLRSKLYFLYHSNDEGAFWQLIKYGLGYSAEQTTADLLKILNSNFDRPLVLLGLGALAKEQWQLETASMWYEQLLRRDFINPQLQQQAYSELADCYLWRNQDIAKAEHFLTLAQGQQEPPTEKQAITLTHLYIRQGKLKEAKFMLEALESVPETFEITYLKGLYCYQSGLHTKAKTIWKPLIKQRSENLRWYHLKNKLLEMYFSQESSDSKHAS